MTKTTVLTATAFIGGYFTLFFGTWSEYMTALVVFMICDFIIGLSCAFFNKSHKTKNGGINSNTCFKGLLKKFIMLIVVALSYHIDVILQTDYIQQVVVVGFICNELLSITENCGALGIPLPQKLINAIEILKGESEDKQ